MGEASAARFAALERLRAAGFPREDALFLAAELWRVAGGGPRIAHLVEPETPSEPELLQAFQALVVRAAAGVPLAYLEGSTGFYGLEFRVDERVLVPRPDSECLVDAALASLAPGAPERVADLGTGSGCLLLALLHHRPALRGVGLDRSPTALALARENARRLGLAPRAHFLAANWLAACAPQSFGLLLANPPYVLAGEELSLGVAEHEPALALFAPAADPLGCYRAILERADTVLRPGGVLILELGAGRAAGVRALGQIRGFAEVECRRDLGGIERALVLRAPAGA